MRTLIHPIALLSLVGHSASFQSPRRASRAPPRHRSSPSVLSSSSSSSSTEYQYAQYGGSFYPSKNQQQSTKPWAAPQDPAQPGVTASVTPSGIPPPPLAAAAPAAPATTTPSAGDVSSSSSSSTEYQYSQYGGTFVPLKNQQQSTKPWAAPQDPAQPSAPAGVTPSGVPPPQSVAAAAPVPAAATIAPSAGDASSPPPPPPPFAHAPIGYFDLDKLTFKGARATADWGTPGDATRPLAKDGTLSAGSWWCSEGGWPSPSPKAHTEIFYMLTGHGCLSDADGAKHYFGPGDTVIIPKGHTGRWDVFAPIHKVWAVNAHERIEDLSPVVRVQVDGYHTFAPQYLTKNGGYDTLYRSPHADISSRTFYGVGPTKVGVWTCGPGSFPVTGGPKSFFHLLEGVVFVTDGETGHARRCVAGDTVMLPEGWSGHIDVIESAKKLWTTAD